MLPFLTLVTLIYNQEDCVSTGVSTLLVSTIVVVAMNVSVNCLNDSMCIDDRVVNGVHGYVSIR